MSKRLQVLVPDSEYENLSKVARRNKVSVSELVRQSITLILTRNRQRTPQEKIAAIMRYARFSGPTGDIEQILGEIDRGRELD